MALLLTLLALTLGDAAVASADGAPLRIADGRYQYQDAVWGMWRHRRHGSYDAGTVAPSAHPPAPPVAPLGPRSESDFRAGTAPQPEYSSVERVTMSVNAAPSPPVAPPLPVPALPAEISRPAEVVRTLDALGPGAAGRLAAARSGTRLVLQVGSFLSIENARGLYGRLSQSFGGVYMSRFDHRGRTFYRVRISRFSGESDLVRVEQALVSAGHAPLRVLTSERADLASLRR